MIKRSKETMSKARHDLANFHYVSASFLDLINKTITDKEQKTKSFFVKKECNIASEYAKRLEKETNKFIEKLSKTDYSQDDELAWEFWMEKFHLKEFLREFLVFCGNKSFYENGYE